MRAASVLLLALASCGRPDAPGGAVLSNAGGYRVTIQSIPATIPFNEPFELRLAVAAKDGGPAPDVAVTVDARMPEHFHGMNRVPSVTRVPDGSFRAEGLLFHMPGLWELHVDITRGARTERAQLDVVLQ